MKSILVATDFSAPSRAAAQYAAALAKLNGATLTLLHAYLLPTPVSEVPYVMVSVEELQKDNEKLVGELAVTLQQQFGIEVKTLVTIGLPADEVVFQSGETGADLIVAGMRGVTNTLDKLIGSTTAAILRKSTLPVLVVPEQSVYGGWKQIAYATDFSYSMNLRCLKMLRELAGKQSDIKLNIVHVQRPGEILTAEQIAGKVRLDPMLEEIPHKYVDLEHVSVEEGLKRFLHDNPCDALVMVAHKHSWWERLFSGSHTREMVYQSEIPLLVLQDK
ncbi:universal stress protein [Flavihumibacter sp. UBA7668]|uniref:universal stress protein n=1 Tax=Flavihumibacter sp. UBA7668 TaxID=1946542 RepID=UPI0025C53359|nr:universal stress protein [Flavihumibacter sp. UBA7668]